MTTNRGFAAIPIIISLALILAITPLAIKEVQNIQDTQRHAATESVCLQNGQSDCFQTPCCQGLACTNHVCTGNSSTNQVPCKELLLAQSTYCSSASSRSTLPTVPCSEITAVINQYCNTAYPTNTPTTIVKPLPTTPISTACTNGQTRCVGGRLIFACSNNNWIYQKICPNLCQDGKCL